MSDFESGTEIGGYSLERQLGRGGFGSVWRAQHIASGRTVAIKVLDRIDDQTGSTALLRHDIEILAGAAAQNSPHLVRVLEGGVDGVPFVVMEYVDGTDLGRQLTRLQRLPQDEVIRIGMGVADALVALHDLGIIHRDVKPANIMIDLRGVVKLTDFGIAKIVGYHSVSQTGQNPLSYFYAAPEVWSGMPSSASDIYAFGVVLWECLMGEPPFRGSPTELLYAHLNRAPDLDALPADIVPALRELLSLCLSKAEDTRPADSHECLEMLRIAEEQQQMRHAQEVEIQKTEPTQFGAWTKLGPHETQAWAWYCRHRVDGREAVVEIRFSPDVRSLNEALRQAREAVRVNPAMTQLGAEELLEADRFLLRPNETWGLPAPSQFPYLIARAEQTLEPADGPVTVELLPTTVASLLDLVAAAEEFGFALNLAPEDVVLLDDGSLHLRRPGLPVEHGAPASDAFACLRSLSLSPEAGAIVESTDSLPGVLQELERLEAERIEAEHLEAARREVERLEAARREAERIEAARREAERLEVARREAERLEAERLEAERLEAERLDAARREAERIEAARVEAARLEAERLAAERLEAERLEAERLEAEHLEAARREVERLEAARREVERHEAARHEAERLETERREAARLAATRLEAERLEAERLAATRLEAKRLEAERLEATRLEAAGREAERLDAERRSSSDAATVLQSVRPGVTMQLFQVDNRSGRRAGATSYDIVFVNSDDTPWTLQLDAGEATDASGTGEDPVSRPHAYSFTIPETVTVAAHSSAGVRLVVAPLYRRSDGESVAVPFMVKASIGERPVVNASGQFEDVPASGPPFWLFYAVGGMLIGFAGVVAIAMLLG